MDCKFIAFIVALCAISPTRAEFKPDTESPNIPYIGKWKDINSPAYSAFPDQDKKDFVELMTPSSGKLLFAKPSLFDNFPFYIHFYATKDSTVSVTAPPERFTKQMKWCGYCGELEKDTADSASKIMKSSHFTEVLHEDRYTKSWYLNFCGWLRLTDHELVRPQQRISHFVGSSYSVVHKGKLVETLREMHDKHKKNGYDTIVPQTHLAYNEVEMKELDKHYKTDKHKNDVYIFKPCASQHAKGIKLINGYTEFKQLKESEKENSVLQEYIKSPYLINFNGKDIKFDIRMYVLVTSLNPLVVLLYDEAVVKFSAAHKTYVEGDYTDLYMHITKNNRFIQEGGQSYKALPCWKLSDLWIHIAKQGKNVVDVQNSIKTHVAKLFVAAEGKMREEAVKKDVDEKNNFSSFQLYGIDVMLDKNLKPWILEVNANPDLSGSADDAAVNEVNMPLLRDTLNAAGIMLPYNVDPMNDEAYKQTLNYRVKNYDSNKTALDHEKEQLYTGKLSSFSSERIKEKLKKTFTPKAGKSKDKIPPILEQLTGGDVRILAGFEDMLTRKGMFTLVHPVADSAKQFVSEMKNPFYSNVLVAEWQQYYTGTKHQEGLERLHEESRKKTHLNEISSGSK